MSPSLFDDIEPELAAVIDAAVDARKNDILAAESIPVDTPHFAHYCSYVLAVYDVVSERLNEEAAERAVARVVSAPEASVTWLRERYGIDPEHPDAAFDSAAMTFKPKGEAIFGSGFTYVQDRLDEDHSWVNITTCYFNDFFRRHGRSQLVRHFCAGDIPFTEELSKPRYGLRFERPTAMGLGDDVCAFRFTRASKPTAAQ